MRILTILTIISFLLSSCASILNPKYQKVVINTKKGVEVQINGENKVPVDGFYSLERDADAKQITLKQEGYKDENFAIFPNKKSPYHILSWIPFGILLYPPFTDEFPRAYNYKSVLDLKKELLPSISIKEEDDKKITIDKISVNLKIDSIKSRTFYSYKEFIRNKDKKELKVVSTEEMEYDNTVFFDTLNLFLKEKGYVDTTKKALKNSYLNNIFLEGSIINLNIHKVVNGTFMMGLSTGKMLYIDLGVKWSVKDNYSNILFTTTVQTTSGQFAYNYNDYFAECMHKSIADAMEYSIIELIGYSEISRILKDISQKDIEAKLDTITIAKSSSYASNMNEAIKACVTIKQGLSQGSGFIISSSGYIITNYHVISRSEDIEIYLNSGTKHKAKIVQISKIHDLALLKIDASNLNSLQLSNSKEPEIASVIYAIGTPGADDLYQTVSKGIVSGIRKTDHNTLLIQTDASVNSGNSGGAMVNKKGQVIGVVSSKLLGYGVEGVAFGIPASDIFNKLKVNIE